MKPSQRLAAEAARRSLKRFTVEAWPEVEPNAPFIDGWHIDAICDHLQAMTSGAITKLIINVPPGHMKSLTCAVLWLAWWWASDPSIRSLHASYASELSERDGRRTLRLVQSSWYQQRWPTRLLKTTESRIETDRGGLRIATSVGGLGTGERGHVVVNDDLMRVNDARSEAVRKAAHAHVDAMFSRGIAGYPFRQLLIMQRLHESDPTGYLLAKDMGFEHLMLPARLDPARRCSTSIGFTDPRTEAGEVLWPAGVDDATLTGLSAALGSFQWSGQYGQSPIPDDSPIFKPDRIKVIDALPAGLDGGVRGWDLAATEQVGTSDPDWTAGYRLIRDDAGQTIIADGTYLRGTPLEVETAISNTASRDGKSVQVSIPQDPGQAGKSQAQAFVRLLGGYTVATSPETGDKVTRATPFAAQVEAGNVVMVRGPWNQRLIDMMRAFPNGAHDDDIDACSRAFNSLFSTTTGILDYYRRQVAKQQEQREKEKQNG